MCDKQTLAEMMQSAVVNRRTFSSIGAAAFVAGCAPGEKSATANGPASGSAPLAEAVTIDGPDGPIDATFYRPGPGRHPAVIDWPDIAGVRPASQKMAERMASDGFAVLHVNPYYRSVRGQQFADFASFMNEGGFDKVGPWRAANPPDAVMRDARTLIGWLDAHESVDTTKGIGTNGHCMTGSWTVYAAHAEPERVKAASSLHGGGLVSDDTQSPHRLLAGTTAHYLFAIGQDDDAKQPGAKTALAAAASEAGVTATPEVFAADHGWTVIDSPKYDEGEAERAYAMMTAMFRKALA